MLSKTLEYDDTIPHERRLSLQLIQTKSQSSPERNHESSAKSLRDVPINLPFDNSLMEKEKEIISFQDEEKKEQILILYIQKRFSFRMSK